MSRRERSKALDGVLPELGRPASKVPRRVRVEAELLQELSAALLRLQDPRLEGTTVTRVEMSDDLRFARVFVRRLGGEAEETTRAALMRALDAAAGRLRSHVGHTVKLRYTPELRFLYDQGPDAALRVEQLLAEIAKEQ
jgi:ribosome-binding factor A